MGLKLATSWEFHALLTEPIRCPYILPFKTYLLQIYFKQCYRIVSNYSSILYFQICLLARIFYPQINIHRSHLIIWINAQNEKKFSDSKVHILCWGWTNDTLPCYFSSYTESIKKVWSNALYCKITSRGHWRVFESQL